MSEIDEFLDEIGDEHRALVQKHLRFQRGIAVPKPPPPKPSEHVQGAQVVYTPEGIVAGARTESLKWLVLSPRKLMAEWFSLVAAGGAALSEPKLAALATLLGAIWVFTKHRHREISPQSAELVVHYWEMSQGGRLDVSEEKLATEFAAKHEDRTIEDSEAIVEALLDMGLFAVKDGNISMTERLVRRKTV